MWRSCCVLLLFVLGTNGKHVVSKNDSELVVAKPRIVVTFLANARQVIRYNESEPEPPSLDPFQRFAQFFFSNILRDLVQPFGRLPDRPSNRTDLKKTCPHGDDGFCPACSSGTPVSTTTKSNSSTATTTKTTSTSVELPKHKRHYFLSISGGTVQRTTAWGGSEHSMRKRAATTKKAGKRVRTSTTEATTEMAAKEKTAAKEVTAAKEETAAKNETAEKDPDDDDDDEDEDEDEEDEEDYGEDGKNDTVDTFNEGASRSPNLNYSKDQYLLTVTTPSLIVFCLMLIAMYFCLKANGFCCRLFLTDPTKKSEKPAPKK